MQGPAQNAGITSSTGVGMTMPALAQAPMEG